ncbi:hypothetical protein E2562_031371 [Oryza meyeriana var. granulata]|uniref:Uncharacterized protein n=1 Tax=Oryza meyeriana var. granulata TaxID=110450 RepID=A0A6G1DSW6_9ORYZ|nr:hypothetical protein E2562_031371 [Oryza meyeriana var. granulata]KAF0914763.1 hypothetical protein E2562_031371 [Oryza meyeriana var. granulata]
MADETELLAGGEPIRPPRLEDAGLEDCALPAESIAEAFSLAAKAVSSRLGHLSLSDDEDDEDGDDRLLPPRGGGAGGCVEDSGPTCGAIPDALVGVGGDRASGADEVVVVGGGGEGGDEVVVGGRGDEEDRVVMVGEERDKKLGAEKGCVEGIKEGIDESGGAEGNGEEGKEEEEEVVVAVEKAILVEDFA